ncbi:MAG: TonB-dependent receptor, partial [Acidobacteria bacterium]
KATAAAISAANTFDDVKSKAPLRTSTIIGTISDDQGAVIPGVTITATNEETGLARADVTNERGTYRVANLPPGRSSVKADLPGFKTQEKTGVILAMGSEISVNLMLALATVQETITVKAQAPLVETTQKVLETTVSPLEIDTLPLKTRNFTDLALLAPGVGVDTGSANSNTDSISFGGMDERYKSLWLEGVDINDDVTRGGTTQSDAVRHSFSQESIQEFQVLSNQYSAEFGRSGSGVINILTKSGTNQFRGRGFYFLRDDAFDKRNAMATGKVPFRNQQWGGTFGGPVIKDRAHFFTTVERRTSEDVVTVSVPAFAAPMMKDPRSELPRIFNASNVFGKLTASFSDKHYLSVNSLYEKFIRKAQNLGGTVAGDGGFDEDAYGVFFNPTVTSVLTRKLSNQFRFAYSRAIKDRVPSGPLGPRVVMPGISFGQATNYPQSREQYNYIFMDTVSYRLDNKWGEHDIKAGFEINKSDGPRTINLTFNGQYQFLRAVTFDPANPATYPEVFQITVGEKALLRDLMIYALFLEDQWRLRSNLTVALGLRYDLQILKGDLAGEPLPDIPAFDLWRRFVLGDLRGINFQAYPNDTNNLAPRVGLAWSPGRDGRTVVRAGAGLFYDVIWTNDTGNVVQNYPGVWTTQYANDVRVTRIPNSFFPNIPDLSILSRRGSTSFDLMNPAALNPSTTQISLGGQRQVTSNMAISADAVYSLGLHYPRTWNPNAILPDRTYPIDPSGSLMTVNDFGARVQAKQLQIRLDRRAVERFGFRVAYTWMDVKTHATAVDDYNRDADWGPAANDVRHRFVFSSTYRIPRVDVRVGGIVSASSAPPYNITTGADDNGNRRTNDRPLDGNGKMIPPYSGRGKSYFNVDLRLSKIIRFGQNHQIEVLWEMFNLTNAVNYGGYQGNMRSTTFGKPSYATSPFQAQFGIRADF